MMMLRKAALLWQNQAVAKPTRAELKAALSDYMGTLARRGARMGGLARAKKLTAEQRRESARRAARARWSKKKARSR